MKTREEIIDSIIERISEEIDDFNFEEVIAGDGETTYIGCKLLSKLYLCHTEYSVLTFVSHHLFVVNCFQNCIFVILNTALLVIFWPLVCCKLLSKLYLCHTEYSSLPSVAASFTVVNCFQNCIFVILNTAVVCCIYPLCSCKLLSKLYLCHTEYSSVR